MTTETKAQHTPGITALMRFGNGLTIVGEDTRNIAHVVGSREDGVRLVDCWNACEGIADPADLRQQRNELLKAARAALCRCTEAKRVMVGRFVGDDELIEQLNAALARCTGDRTEPATPTAATTIPGD